MTARSGIAIAAAALVAGCGYVSAYEEAVYDREPVYCYRTLGGVSCFDEPVHRDERRLVNYFGPAPERYERPEPPPPARLDAPPPVPYFVRDAEPVPRAAPLGPLADRPWLAPASPGDAPVEVEAAAGDSAPAAGDEAPEDDSDSDD